MSAAGEQAAWLTNRIMPHALRTGVVPKGLFEILDVHGKTHALAAERWTSADDWLAFIEAMDHIGINKELNRSWLENLARVHGVTVQEIWGLDWSVPLQRPDAISTELTARFARVANLLGYQQAAAFAQQNLNRLYQTNLRPVVLTTASTDAPSCMKRSTVARPIPTDSPGNCPAPTTIATLPSSRPVISSCLIENG